MDLVNVLIYSKKNKRNQTLVHFNIGNIKDKQELSMNVNISLGHTRFVNLALPDMY